VLGFLWRARRSNSFFFGRNEGKRETKEKEKRRKKRNEGKRETKEKEKRRKKRNEGKSTPFCLCNETIYTTNYTISHEPQLITFWKQKREEKRERERYL
jgi:hypothetical protein